MQMKIRDCGNRGQVCREQKRLKRLVPTESLFRVSRLTPVVIVCLSDIDHFAGFIFIILRTELKMMLGPYKCFSSL